MTKLYVAYEQGVYRQNTIAVNHDIAVLEDAIINYYGGTDDYHEVCIEALESGCEPIVVHEYFCKSTFVNVCKPSALESGRYLTYEECHGERTIYKDNVAWYRWDQLYTLSEGESFENSN